MSMSDDVQRAGAPKKEGIGLKNPYASAGAGQSGGKPATGLPGLAAFGQMQTYTPQTAQPQRQEQQPQQQESAPEPEPIYERPSLEAASYEETAAQEQDFAAAHAYQQDDAGQADESHAQGQVYAAQPEQDLAQAHEDAGFAADADHYSYAGNAEAHGESGQAQGLSFSDLTDVYRNGSADQSDDEAAHDFTAEDLQSYMAGNGQGAHHDQALEEEEDFDLSKHMSLQPFEARYDQQRPVDLGGYDEPDEQPFFYPEQQDDADFLADEQADEQIPPPGERKSRRALMFASGLIGALALGGALAFAYKMTGETQVADGSAPPLIKADESPVKVAPEEPGGKQFAHQNKQIYDRLQGDEKPEVERIVPREEAVQETPPTSEQESATAEPNNSGPHKVRTLKVMPDGSVVVSAPPAEGAAPAPSAPAQNAPAQQPMPMQSAQPSIPALPAPGSETAGVAVTMPPEPQPQQADQTTVASVPSSQEQQAEAAQPVEQQQQLTSDTAPAPMPQPKPTAPERQTASVAPSQAAGASSGSGYVVQVASRRSQAMALAAFADLQQKYTSLLGDYQPMIQSADLGDKGVWYRLRVGPIGQKADADSLCNNLKKAGLRSCLVRPL